MAPRKRKAVFWTERTAKKRRVEGEYSNEPTAVKERARQEKLKGDPIAAAKDLNRSNRNVASSRAVKDLKKTDAYQALTWQEQKDAENAEKAKVKAEYDAHLEKQLAQVPDAEEDEESRKAALNNITHWLVAEYDQALDDECEGKEQGWEWDSDDADGVHPVQDVERSTHWAFRSGTFNAIIVEHWGRRIRSVLDKVKLMSKNILIVSFTENGEVVPDRRLFQRLLSKKQFNATIAKGRLPKPHQIFDPGERAIIRNIRTWDEKTNMTPDNIPHWWPSAAEYDYDRYGFTAQFDGFVFKQNRHVAQFLFEVCVVMKETYGSTYKPGTFDKPYYAQYGWLFDMMFFEHGKDPKSEFLKRLSLSRSELRLRTKEEIGVWDEIKTATDLQEEWKSKGVKKAKARKAGRPSWDLRR